MEPRERRDATSVPMARDERESERIRATPIAAEQLLLGFSFPERQRLRYLRQLYERGKLTEFPRQPRD
jgi:hypothetical protein